MTVWRDVAGNLDGAGQISEVSRERVAPDAIDSILRGVAKFLFFRRTDQGAETYLMEFDIWRQKAEARMITGAGFPDEFAPVRCVRNAALAKNERTLVLASLGNASACPQVSAQMRRVFGRGRACP